MTILIFDTTHHAMWAEELARENGIAAEVVPAPEQAEAKCGLALEIFPESVEQLTSVLNREGVPHRVL